MNAKIKLLRRMSLYGHAKDGLRRITPPLVLRSKTGWVNTATMGMPVGLFSMNSYLKFLRYKKFFQLWVIVLLCSMIYIPSLRNGFIWDDDINFYRNPWIQKTEGLKAIWLSNNKTYQYYPVHFTTFWLEHKLLGLSPFSAHAINLALHIINSLLFFWVGLKIYPRLAFVSALLFAIHPIQVETVAWITERKNLLSLFFFLLAVSAYLRFDRSRRIKDYLFTIVMFVCALLSKPVAVCFIGIPVLYKWWQDERVSWREIRLSTAFIILGSLSALQTVYLELHNVGAQGAAFDLTFLQRIILAARIIFFYIYKILFPFNFMFFYPRWAVATQLWWQWLFPLALVFVLASLIKFRKKIGRGALALFIFYLISIFPALGFFNVYSMQFSFVADHYSYIFTPCLLLLLCAGIIFFLDRIKIKLSWLSSAPYKILKPSLFVLIVIYMCGQSQALTRNYKDDLTLWTNLIGKNPRAWIAYNNLGFLKQEVKKTEEAISLYNKAIELNPGYALAYVNRGNSYRLQGNLNQALSDYNQAIEANPKYAIAYVNRGNIYQNQGRLNQALSDYNQAIEINPKYAIAYVNRGNIYQKQGRPGEAIFDYNQALKLNPNLAEAYYNRGSIYQSQGDLAQALMDYEKGSHLINPN